MLTECRLTALHGGFTVKANKWPDAKVSSTDLDSGGGSGDSQQPLRVQSLALDVLDELEEWTKSGEGKKVCSIHKYTLGFNNGAKICLTSCSMIGTLVPGDRLWSCSNRDVRGTPNRPLSKYTHTQTERE